MDETIQHLFERGYRQRAEHDPVESRASFLDAVRRSALEADRAALAEALCGLAQAERDLENLPAAHHHYESAVVLYRQMKMDDKLAYALRHQADLLRELGKPKEAEALFREAEQIYRRLGDRHTLDLANTLRGLALSYEAIGKSADAKHLWQEARSLYANSKVHAGVAEADKHLAQ